MEHITLRVLDEQCTQVVHHEVVEVSREGATAVRLLHSPAYVDGIARGDLIELDPELLSGFRVLERSGLLAATVGFVSEDQRHTAEPVLREQVASLGGLCEGGPERALVFSIPVQAGFQAVEGFLDFACKQFAGSGWYFGNVYGADGAPLNWWVKNSP